MNFAKRNFESLSKLRTRWFQLICHFLRDYNTFQITRNDFLETAYMYLHIF